MEIKKFWEGKILDWEKGRYGVLATSSWMEKIANRSSNSLRFRLSITPDLLKPHILGKRVVELGCGSGLIARRLIDLGAREYVGIDIAENAIEQAKARTENQDPRIQFQTAEVSNLNRTKADIVFSIGLLDWLLDSEIIKIFETFSEADFLHSFSEKRSNIEQWIHRLYVELSYGHKTGDYRPRYISFSELKSLALRSNLRSLHVFRDRRLSFGAFISSLPIDIGP